jgi:hypothetical protein
MSNNTLCDCPLPKEKKYSEFYCKRCWTCKRCGKYGGCDELFNQVVGISMEGNLLVKTEEGLKPMTELADKVRRKAAQETEFKKVNDSGQRRETVTGAVRDRQQGKGRYDLITPIGLRRLALHYENGARKYKDRNWEKGMPLSWFLDSAIRHMFDYLAGDRSEDHLAAVAWNALGFIHIEQLIRDNKLPKELDDLGTTNRPLMETV